PRLNNLGRWTLDLGFLSLSQIPKHLQALFHNDFGGFGSEWGDFHFITTLFISTCNRQVAESTVRVSGKQSVGKWRAFDNFLVGLRKGLSRNGKKSYRIYADSLQLPIDISLTLVESSILGTHTRLSRLGPCDPDLFISPTILQLHEL